MNDKLLIQPGTWYAEFDGHGTCTAVWYADSFCRLLGCDPETFSGENTTWMSSIHPEDKERAIRELNKCVSEMSAEADYDIEYRMMTKQGYRWFHDYAHCVRRKDGSGTRCDGVIFDIDDAVRQRKSLADHRLLLDYFVDQYWSACFIDLENDTLEVLRANNANTNAYIMNGSHEDMERFIESHFHPDDKALMHRITDKAYIRRVLKEQASVSYTAREIIGGEEKTMRILIVRGADADHVAVGFMDITDEVLEQKKHLLGAIPLSNDVLAKANIGLWAFELDEGQPPRMYADETMLGLIGLTEQRPPEETYHAWYDRIDAGSYTLVSNAVEKMTAGEHAEVQYPWHHPNGETWIVRCGGVRNPQYTQGIRIEGTHQNVTRMIHFDEERQRLNEELINRMADADGLFVIDCRNDSRKTVHDVHKGREIYRDGESYSAGINRFISDCVAEADRETMRKMTAPDYMLARCAAEKEFSVEYRSISSGVPRFYEMRVTGFSDTEVLQSFRENDRGIFNRIVYQNIENDYFALFGVDIDAGIARILKKSPWYEKGEVGDLLPYTETIRKIARSFAGETHEFYERISDLGYLKHRLARDGKVSYAYRSPLLGADRWVDASVRVLTRHEDGTPSLAAIGFTLLDSDAAEKEELKSKLQESLTFTNFFLDRYVSAYYVGLNDLSCQVYKRTDRLEGEYPIITNFIDSLDRYIAADVHPDDRARLTEITRPAYLKRELAKQPEITYVLRDISDGIEKTYRFQAIRGADDSHIAFGFIDISEEMKAQQEQQKLFHLRDFGSIVNAALWSVDINNDNEITGVYWSDEMRHMFGFENEEDFPNAEEAWSSRLHPDDKETVMQQINSGLSFRDHAETVFEVNYRIRRKGGDYRWYHAVARMEEGGNTARKLYGLIKDISAEKETEESQKLIESVASVYRFAFAVNMASNEFKIIRLENEVKNRLHINTVSSYREAIAPLFEMLHPSDRERMAHELDFATIRKKLEDTVSYDIEYRVITNGATNWHEMNVTYISGDEVAMGFGEKDIEITKRHLEENRFAEYFALYEVDVDSGTAKIILDSPYYGIDRSGTALPYTPVMRAFSASLEGEAKTFFRELSDLEYVKKELAKEGKHTFTYRSSNLENSRWVDCTIYVTYRHEDGTPSMFTMGFSYIDSSGAARQDLQDQIANQKALLEEQQAQLQAALDTANTEAQKNDLLISAIHAGRWSYAISADDEVTAAVYSDDIYRSTNARSSGKPMGWLDYLYPEDKGRVLNEFMAAIFDHSGKTGYDTTFRLVTADGRTRWRRSAGRVIRHADGTGEFYGMNMDITDQIAQQEKLARRTAISDYFLKSYANAYYVDLIRNEVLVLHSVKGFAASLIGQIIPLDATVRRYLRHVHPDDREQFERYMSTAFIRTQAKDSREFSFIYREVSDTVTNSYRCTIMPGNDEDHVAIGFRNITEELLRQKEEREQLEEALSMAQAASKAKTEFLFNMSHDIRTPMNAILGFTSIAEKHLDDREKVADCLEKTKQSGNLLLTLINSVLDMSRIESGSAESEEQTGDVYLSFASIESTLHEEAAAKDIDLSFSFGEIRDRYVFADFTRCLRVFTNLITNSIKYTKAGGYVRVRCEQAENSKEGHATFRYTVEDNGAGMSEEFQKHMFEAFTREHNSTVSGIQGTGLGLSVCKTFVDYLGGTIACESKQGKGTKFTVELPFRLQQEKRYIDPLTGEARSNDAGAAPAHTADFSGKRVLLVEDNEMNREIAIELLEEEGFLMEEAEDGSVAVDILKRKGPSYYDFILMDIQMPIMNGYEATKAIRTLFPEAKLPIIALSANAFAEDKKASRAAGMNDHVAKPINIKELLGVLAKYM